MTPPSGLDLSGLLLVGSKQCPPCHQASEWLAAHDIEFKRVSCDGDNELIQWLMQATGQKTVPQFFWKGEWVAGGFTEVRQLAAQAILPKQP